MGSVGPPRADASPTPPRADLDRIWPYIPGRHRAEIAREYGVQDVLKLANGKEDLLAEIVRKKTFLQPAGPVARHGVIDARYRFKDVDPATPAELPPLAAGAPRNRLGLARWLVDPANPLTSRVAVNRAWQLHFGVGLVKTAEDFGRQGEWPSHPELLDWLAAEFMDCGWDQKHLHRAIVTSGTFRQSSQVTPVSLARDSDNRLLSRAPRLRLPAEMVR